MTPLLKVLLLIAILTTTTVAQATQNPQPVQQQESQVAAPQPAVTPQPQAAPVQAAPPGIPQPPATTAQPPAQPKPCPAPPPQTANNKPKRRPSVWDKWRSVVYDNTGGNVDINDVANTIKGNDCLPVTPPPPLPQSPAKPVTK